MIGTCSDHFDSHCAFKNADSISSKSGNSEVRQWWEESWRNWIL